MEAAAVLPLLSSGRPIIEVWVNRIPIRMMVDTGAQTSLVTPETAAMLDLDKDYDRGLTRTLGVGGQAIVRNIIVKKLSIGGVDYLNRSLPVIAIEGSGAEVAPEGIVGDDFLRDFNVELDLPNRKITLYRRILCAHATPPWAGPYQTLLATVTDRKFRIPVELNGHSLTALFDTGAQGGVVSLAGAESAGASDADLDKDPRFTGKGAGRLEFAGRQHRFDTLRIGGEIFHNVPLGVVDFHQPGVDMMVGLSYVQTRRIYLSYSTAQLFVQNAQNPAQVSAKPDPCEPSKGMLPYLTASHPVVISHPKNRMPEKARAAHVEGCAAVVFRLTPDGTPADINFAAESPEGYGFADLFMQEIVASRFQPSPPDENQWYYEVRRYRR